MRFIHYLSPILLGLAVNVSAQVFEASGVGDTPEAAKKDAINNAIRFGAGEFVLSKEELNNEDFSQKIISHSNAYIKQIEVKSQVKLPNGSYETQVAVDLENQALLKSLKEMKVAVVENAVDNEALLQALNHFDKQDAIAKKEQDLKALIYELMVKPIEENKEIYRVEILGKLKPLTPEPSYNGFPFELTYQITPMYIDNYKKLLDEMEMDKSTPMAGVRKIGIVDLTKKERLPPKIIYTTSNSYNLLYDIRQLYQVYWVTVEFIDNNEVVFKTEHNRVYAPLDSSDGEEIRILLGSYSQNIKLYLTKDEVLKLKNIRVSLGDKKVPEYMLNKFKKQ